MSEAPPVRHCSQCRSILLPDCCLTRLFDHCKNHNRERQVRYVRKKNEEAQCTSRVAFASGLPLKHTFLQRRLRTTHVDMVYPIGSEKERKN
ncbi:hypothetical protein I308_103712 [Cryptococcus tetragattii IND107]|uniref:Uncharacterized protein n=1 Tax=Cryptococcus tetragattii IND107 TaxID=1296105 RepID=A0ABR3BR14_9TREE